MCDTLVERLTGATKATDAYTTELQVVLTDEALLGTDTTTEGLGTLTKQQLRYRLALQHAAIHTEQPHPALARLPQIFADRTVPTG